MKHKLLIRTLEIFAIIAGAFFLGYLAFLVTYIV